MTFTVKFFVNCRVLDSEIGAEIDDSDAGLQERFGKLSSESMGQREENDFSHPRKLRRIRFDELERFRFVAL